METIIYFEENGNRLGVIRFVKSFRQKSFFKKERIEYSFSSVDGVQFIDDEIKEKVVNRIKRDYPEAKIHQTTWDDFAKKYKTHVFWLIAHLDKKNHVDGYYSGKIYGGHNWTTDIEDAEIGFDADSIDETLDNIRKATGEKIYSQPIYMNLINGLLEPNFMITCTSKRGKQETKYFSRIEGNRVRLVENSNTATKYNYSSVLSMYEHLKANNKNFLYVVLPAFKDNVHYKNLEIYLKEKNVSRMIQMTTKLRWLNR